MKITKVTALVWLVASMQSFGAVEATLFHVTTNDTFTVPTGKVLIIENIRNIAGNLFLQKGTNGFQPFADAVEPNLPIKIPEGWILSSVSGAGGPPEMWIFGLLVDSSDLFASLQHRIDEIAVNGTTATLGIQMASARPARINVEKSVGVEKGWQTAESAVVVSTSDKTRYVATIPIEEDKEFLRTKARPRER